MANPPKTAETIPRQEASEGPSPTPNSQRPPKRSASNAKISVLGLTPFPQRRVMIENAAQVVAATTAKR